MLGIPVLVAIARTGCLLHFAVSARGYLHSTLQAYSRGLVFAVAAESSSQVSAITWAIITSCGSPLAQNAVYQG